MKKKTILLVGGGSGGHLFPLIPLIQNISPDWDIHLLTGDSPHERRMVQESFHSFPLSHHQIKTGKIRAYISLKNITDLPVIFRSLIKAFRLLKQINPDVIFFKGGHVGFPLAVALRWECFFRRTKRSVFLHESDITPGKLHHILTPIANQCFGNFDQHPLFYYEKTSSIPTNKRPKILVFGGSQGAQWINQMIQQTLKDLTKTYDVILITGPDKKISPPSISHFIQYETLDQSQMFQTMATSDIIVARAGASLFQIFYLKKKSLIIPLPNSARDHQKKNAQYFHEQGLCHVLEQKDADHIQFLQSLKDLSQDTHLPQALSRIPFPPADKAIWKILQSSLEPTRK